MQTVMPSSSSSTYTIAVVGLGKIGLPLAVQYASHGHKVLGCDSNAHIITHLNHGKSHVQGEPELLEALPRLVEQRLFLATTDTTAAVEAANVVVVIVPVYIDAMQKVDFQQIDAATAAIGAGLRPGTLVIYETTLPVGTTALRLLPRLEQISRLQAGSDFYLAYSPERVSSGSIFRDLQSYPKIVGGIDSASTVHATAFYRAVLDAEIITMASTDEAEYVKLIETSYRDVNIALANEYACYADSHGINVHAAIAAANTQPYSHIHMPGVGVGGHCIPVYPYFLFANPYDTITKEITTYTPILPRYARCINDAMAEYAVQRLEEALGPLAQQAILMLGVAYRGDVHEMAFTSAKLLQHALIDHGAQVYVDDPHFSEDELHAEGYSVLPPEHACKIAAIVLQCGHQAYQNFDFSRFTGCKVVLDGRNALRREMIESLDMCYITIGGGKHPQVKRNLSTYSSEKGNTRHKITIS
jgi:nucleotide sugar dehydrogenase